MTPKLKFSEGEKVLCFHGPLIYEAKALKSQITKDKQIKYYIHYNGWNKSWDEWVPECRVLKYNEVNVMRQKEVNKQHLKNKRKKGGHKGKKGDANSSNSSAKDGAISSGGSESRTSTPTKDINNAGTTSSASVQGRINRSKANAKELDKRERENEVVLGKDDEATGKRKRSVVATNTEKTSQNNASVTNSTTSSHSSKQVSVTENEDTFLTRVEVKIKIPDELKQCLADDWDAITRQHKLLDIPAKITVQDVVDQYIAYKKLSKVGNATKEVALQDVLSGIIEYFNVMLGSQLLYKFERPQYAEVLVQHPDLPPAKLYGTFHLLRLFVKLGTMLGFSALDERSMQTLLGNLMDFLKFLVKNSTILFNMSSFVNASPEYYRHTQ